MVPWPPLPMGSGGRGRVLSVRMLSVGWGGGQPSVGLVLESPAALMDRPMMGPAHQDQVVQVGRAAIQPVDQMVGLAPGQGAVTVGEDTAAVAHGQGGALGGLDDSGGPADVQGLGRGAIQDRGEQGGGGPQPGGQVLVAAGAVPAVGIVAAGMVVVVLVVAAGVAMAVVVVAGGVLVAVTVVVVVAVVAAGVVVVAVVVGGLAGDQDPGDGAVTGQPLTGLR